jgi:hypothetical protein
MPEALMDLGGIHAVSTVYYLNILEYMVTCVIHQYLLEVYHGFDLPIKLKLI